MPTPSPISKLDPGKGIARTMNLLAASGPGSTTPVRILVYGQSISQQDWWQQVRDSLASSYPNARIVMESRAVGGFHSTRLRGCAIQDVLAFAPDLILFHDYGPEDDYEAMIRIFRSRAAAEVAVQNDHIAVGQDQAWHDRHSHVWLPDLCLQYGLEFIDVRSCWRRYLAEKQLQPSALLSDQVHLNEPGNRLMARIVLNHLAAGQAYTNDPYGLAKTLLAGQDFVVEGKRVKLQFVGSRVDLSFRGPALMKILVDGQSPTRIMDTYIAESPYLNKGESRPPRVGIPIRIALGSPREVDTWTMYIDESLEDGKEVRFRLYSQSGDWEGAGSSSEPFTALSGRVMLQPDHWFVRETPEFFEGLPAIRAGDAIHWEVTCLGRDLVHSDADGQQTITIVDGLPNRTHSLVIESLEGSRLPVEALHIYKPFLKDPG